MKRICMLLVVTGLIAMGVNAQTVTGSGTTNTVPKFTGSSTIGDSVIVETNGNIGVGAGAINFFLDGKLTVRDTRDVNASGVGPSSIYGVAGCRGPENFPLAALGRAEAAFRSHFPDGGRNANPVIHPICIASRSRWYRSGRVFDGEIRAELGQQQNGSA